MPFFNNHFKSYTYIFFELHFSCIPGLYVEEILLRVDCGRICLVNVSLGLGA